MVSSSPQDEKQKNLKYKLKELVIGFTYHSSHVPFGWRRIRPVVLFGVLQKWVNVCFASSLLSLKSPSLSMTGVHEKNFIARKIAVSYMNGQCSLQFELLFTVTCFKWLTEDLLKNDSPSKVRLSNSAAPKSARSRSGETKKTFLLSRACADKSLRCSTQVQRYALAPALSGFSPLERGRGALGLIRHFAVSSGEWLDHW